MRRSILIGIAIALTAMVAVACKSSPKETVYDVYVAGSEAHDPFWKTELWVNGKSASAPSADGGLKAVFVSGNDVYVAGSEILEGGSSMSAALWMEEWCGCTLDSFGKSLLRPLCFCVG